MEVYVIAIVLFLCAFVLCVIFFSCCYKKGNNKKNKKHGEQNLEQIDIARRRNRASILSQTYGSGGIGAGNYNGNDASGGGAALMAGAAAMSAALTSIAIDGDNGGGDGS
ncbi:unnamed protein product [Withania somnifera]